MPLPLRTINYDLSQFTGDEFAVGETFLRITPTVTTVCEGIIVPAITVTFNPDGDGQGTFQAVPGDLGTPKFDYRAELYRRVDGGVSPYQVLELPRFRVPVSSGPFVMADLMAAGIPPAETTYWQAITQAEYEALNSFGTRSALGVWVASNTPLNGVVYTAAGLQYLGQTGATAIPDLPGLVPNGAVYVDHFGPVRNSAQAIAAMAYANASGAELNMFAATYEWQGVQAPSNGRITLKGVYGATIIKAPNGVDATCFSGNSPTGSFDYVKLEGIIFDGNKSNSLGVIARSSVSFAGVKYWASKDCVFRNATGYGLGLQAYGGTSFTGPQSIIYMENCQFNENGDGVGADEFDGLDIKSGDKITLIHCVADGNTDKGINIRGRDVTLISCFGINTVSGSGIELNLNAALGDPGRFTLLGCGATGNAVRGLILTNTYTGGGAALLYADVFGGDFSENTIQGIYINSPSDKIGHVTLNATKCLNNGGAGIRAIAPSLANFEVIGAICEGNGDNGIYIQGADARIIGGRYVGNTGRGIVEDISAGTRTYVSGADVSGNTVGGILDRGAMIIRDCRGYRTEARLQATGVSLAATGTVSVNVAHGLPFTPPISQCYATLGSTSTNSFALAWGPRVVSTDATNINVAINVATAAAGGTATINVTVLPRATA